MRINIYSEELTEEVIIVVKTAANTGETFYGVRMMLLSSNQLHHDGNDDDRSAVTFWFTDPDDASMMAKGIKNAIISNAS